MNKEEMKEMGKRKKGKKLQMNKERMKVTGKKKKKMNDRKRQLGSKK